MEESPHEKAQRRSCDLQGRSSDPVGQRSTEAAGANHSQSRAQFPFRGSSRAWSSGKPQPLTPLEPFEYENIMLVGTGSKEFSDRKLSGQVGTYGSVPQLGLGVEEQPPALYAPFQRDRPVGNGGGTAPLPPPSGIHKAVTWPLSPHGQQSWGLQERRQRPRVTAGRDSVS